MPPKIKILEPCNQDWNNMPIQEKGKFCKSCHKRVIDFTGYTSAEIFSEIKDKKKVCGRIDRAQLQQTDSIKKLNETHYAKLALILGIGSILGITEPALSSPVKPLTELRQNAHWASVLPKKKVLDSVTIQGKVFDKNYEPVQGINIVLKGTKLGVQTDEKGNFSISIPLTELKPENYLIFSFVGFETREYRFYKKNKYLEIKMKEDTAIMGEVIIVSRPSTFNKIGNFLDSLFSKNKSCN